MLKLLSGASIVALIAIAPAAAQTTSPSTTTPPAATQDKSTTPPAATQDKSAQPEKQSGAQPGAQSQPASMTMTEEDAKNWVDKPVYSSDGKEIGEVVEFKRTSGNQVSELHADIGGLMGMGETRVKLMPSEFKLQGDRVVLNVTEEQAKALPKVKKQ